MSVIKIKQLLVPTLCVGMQRDAPRPVSGCLKQSSCILTGTRSVLPAFPRRAWERDALFWMLFFLLEA
ncbi:MAG: hypothetical protein GY749_07270 [Desulfobacteraceae bacterium]|nr:hypothetical protein [Desulfobacteraceae bacterium]